MSEPNGQVWISVSRSLAGKTTINVTIKDDNLVAKEAYGTWSGGVEADTVQAYSNCVAKMDALKRGHDAIMRART